MERGQTLRDAIDAYFAGQGETRLARLRDPQDRTPSPARGAYHWLTSEPGQDALQEAREGALLSAQTLARIQQQLAFMRYGAVMLRAERRLLDGLRALSGESGQPLHAAEVVARIAFASDAPAADALGREFEHALRELSGQWVEDCIAAEQPLLQPVTAPAPADPGASPPRMAGGLLIVSSIEAALALERAEQPSLGLVGHEDGEWAASARDFLTATDAAAEDAVRFCAREQSRQYPLPWPAWLRALRAPELDSPAGSRQRWRRAAAWLRGVGFDREMDARLRAEVAQDAALPVARTALLAVPRDVRVAQSSIDYGVASDVMAAEGVGIATGLALILPTLPAELRWPLPGCASDALGGLSGQLWGDRGHLRSVQGMGGPETERVGRLASCQVLLHARLACAVATAPVDEHGAAGVRTEALAEAAARALGCDLPASLAGLLCGDRPTHQRRARGYLVGLALHHALRERFDEDWYRDPRAGEPLRAACGRGNGVPAQTFLEELGGSLSAASDRGVELVT